MNPHHRRQARACLIHFLAPQTAGVIGGIGLHLAFIIKAKQTINHLTAGKTAARIFEKRLPRKRGFGKGRKLAADKVKIKLHVAPRLFSRTVQAVWGICKGRHWDWACKWQCDIDRKAKACNSKTLANRQIGKAPTSPWEAPSSPPEVG